jgi:hypothetical protein
MGAFMLFTDKDFNGKQGACRQSACRRMYCFQKNIACDDGSLNTAQQTPFVYG